MKIRISLKLKIIIVLIFAANCPNNIFSQTRSGYPDDPMISTKVHSHSLFGFSLTPYLVNKAKTQPMKGNYHLTTSYKHGFEAGPDLYIHISNNYSLKIGLHAGGAATNYILFIPGNDFNPSIGSGDVNDIGKGPGSGLWSFYMCTPIWIQKRWFTKSNSFWNIVAGVSVKYYPVRYFPYGVEEIYTDTNGNKIPVLDMNVSIGNNLRPWLNYNIGGGYSFLLRNNNYLQCNLLANFSDKKIVNGTYTINVSGKPQSTGIYSANLSYVGLSFSYIFTGTNKRLRKMYEENLK